MGRLFATKEEQTISISKAESEREGWGTVQMERERERKGDEEKEETSSPRTHIIIRVTQFISRDCTDGRRNLREKTRPLQ